MRAEFGFWLELGLVTLEHVITLVRVGSEFIKVLYFYMIFGDCFFLVVLGLKVMFSFFNGI